MAELAVAVVSSLGCGAGAKPERHRVSEAKSSVSGIGIEAHGVVCGLARMDLRCAMSNSRVWAAPAWVVESRYFGPRLRGLWNPDTLVRRERRARAVVLRRGQGP